MTNQNNAAQAAEQEIREAFELTYAADADDPACAADLFHFTNGYRAVLSKLRAPVADEHCSACNPQVFSVEQLEKDPLLVARLWRKPADTDGSLVERILEHVSEYGESMASSSLLSLRTIARRNLEARIEAELADAMRSQDESPLREALSEIASAWSARTRLPEEDGIQALKDIARAALASAPVAAPSDETLRLAGVIADKIEDGTLFQAGIFSRRELADKVRAVVRFVSAASAPVAGEAVGVVEPLDERGNTNGMMYRNLPIGTLLYAAPQASAEYVRDVNAAMAAEYQQWINWYHKGLSYDCFLKECVFNKTQADKDGGQQRAGDAVRDLIAKHAELLESSDYVYFELARTRRTGWMAWLCSHPAETHPDRKVLARGQGVTPDEACRAALADFDARAALSATQAGQGERDA